MAELHEPLKTFDDLIERVESRLDCNDWGSAEVYFTQLKKLYDTEMRGLFASEIESGFKPVINSDVIDAIHRTIDVYKSNDALPRLAKLGAIEGLELAVSLIKLYADGEL